MTYQAIATNLINMSTERILLSPDEITSSSKALPLWEVKDNKSIQRKFHFTNFIQALAFMTKVAIIAEKMSHHPEWKNIYSDVEINLTTHDIGGISYLDFKLAKAIDEL